MSIVDTAENRSEEFRRSEDAVEHAEQADRPAPEGETPVEPGQDEP